ncbi:hypothetical protein [Sphingobium boeckii]|uniref:SIR2-like domain-containing protein n=1 Tax=Sphingobium boeckii TaxID=1082345 RepID=A0A7W9EDQ5_9SPHN|nr:hypothetical protein [Sphingobium boeckii]MBB5685174.1 hypothetical protein [Sphingobium boeckii]
MFNSKTLFIIGAGASCEANLPSGEGLKSKIASLLNIKFDNTKGQYSGDIQITQALRDYAKLPDGRSGDINPYLYKAWRIADVLPAAAISIDNFLNAHQGDVEMELCGKLGIVKSILDAERESALGSHNTISGKFNLHALIGTWYVGFFQMLTENVSRARASSVFENVSIITFNYDRCIERFLIQALADYYDLTMPEAEQIMINLPIYHPYGKVGPLPWQDPHNAVPFGSSTTNLLTAAQRVKTFTEGMGDDDTLALMHDAVTKAETIVFIGFAFHPANMQLLTPPESTQTKRIFGTTLGLSDADEAVIEEDILKILHKDLLTWDEQIAIKPRFAQMTGGAFFKQYFRSLSASPK